MALISEYFPDEESFLELTPDELVAPLLRFVVALEAESLHPEIVSTAIAREYPSRSKDVSRQIMSAWTRLEREGHITLDVKTRGGYVVTDAGNAKAREVGLFPPGNSSILNRSGLHFLLRENVWRSFVRGDYPGAVTQAFERVESAIRGATGLSAHAPRRLLKEAFDSGTGPLRDPGQDPGANDAFCKFVSGAFGVFLSDSGHATPTFGDPREAAEVIGVANYLLRIVERRSRA